MLRTAPPPGFRGGYAEFLLAGLLPWMGIQEALSRGTASITDHAHLVKKLRFPLEALVVASLCAALLLQAAALALFAGFIAATGHGSLHPVLLIGAFALELVLLSGPVFVLASLNVFFRDLTQILGPALMILFYLTPILYPESLVPPAYAPWLELNPLRDLVALFRAGLYGTAAPPPAKLALWSALFLVLAFLGRSFFRRSRRSFADLL